MARRPPVRGDFKWLLRGASAALFTISMAVAMAHGDWPPKHGGVMNEGGETSFELVAQQLDIVLHVEDHGTPVETTAAKGLLTVTRGEISWTSEIKAVGGNRLGGTLTHPLRAGDKVLARVTMGNGSIAAGRFVIKEMTAPAEPRSVMQAPTTPPSPSRPNPPETP